MAWLKVDDRVRTHPKIVEAGPLAAWVWFCGICYCREHLTDGFIADKMLATLVPGLSSLKKAAASLVAAGLWHRGERGYQVHDFLDWNPSRADVEKQRAIDRARKGTGFPSDSRRIPEGPPTDSDASRDAHRGSGSGSLSVQALPGSEKDGAPKIAPNGAIRGPGLIMTSAEYARKKETHRHVGARLHVPNVLHRELMLKLGGDDPDAALVAWYDALDKEVEATREPIPDLFKWIRPKFVDWATTRADDAEFQKILAWAAAEDAAEANAKAVRHG